MRELAIALLVLTACATPKQPSRLERAESHAAKIERALNDAESFLEAAQPDAAVEPLQVARKLLEAPITKAYPDRFFLKERLDKAEIARKAVIEGLARRRAEAEIARYESQLEEIMERASPVRARLKQAGAEVTNFEFEEASKVSQELSSTLETIGGLQKKTGSLQATLKKAKGVKKKLERELIRSGRYVAFRDGPVRARKEGLELMRQAKRTGEKGERRALYRQARRKFLECKKQGKTMLKASSMLRKARFFVGARRTSPKKVVSACRKKAKQAKRKMRR